MQIYCAKAKWLMAKAHVAACKSLVQQHTYFDTLSTEAGALTALIGSAEWKMVSAWMGVMVIGKLIS